MKKILVIILFVISINGFSQFCHAYFGFWTDYFGNAYFLDYSYSEHVNDTIISHTWLFGDGFTGNSSDPIHHYFQAGDYNVCHIIETSFGCIDTVCGMVNIPEYCTMEINPVVTNVSIYGSANGEIILDVNLGMPPYNYLWSTGDTTSSIDSLAAGTYSVTVCDGFCCDSLDIVITEPDTMLYEITGLVYAGNNLLPKGIALIYEKQDSTTVKAIKYSYIENGEYILYPNKAGKFYIYAIPYVEVEYPYTPVYFPTYYGDKILWKDALILDHDTVINNVNIHLKSNATFLWGDAVIYGNIQYIYSNSYESSIYNWDWFDYFDNTSDKFTNAQNIPILLLENDTTPLLFTLSDENGNFSFPNLEYGTYQVYAEKAGFFTEYGEITVDSLNPVKGLNFIIGNKQIILDIQKNPESEIHNEIKIYPNPANTHIIIDFAHLNNKILNIQITNTLGQPLMIHNDYSAGDKIDISNLQYGVYYVQISIDGKTSSRKLVVN